MTEPNRWPDNRRFAFTVFDDCDRATVEGCRPVYDLLKDLGLRTTKSVWPLKGGRTPSIGGQTCEDPEYLEWVLELHRDGFEIGYHNATFHSSAREETQRGLDRFREIFGHDPVTMANHLTNREAVYWGNDRVSGLSRCLLSVLTAASGRRRRFDGHREGTPHFWGDLCRDRIRYARTFVFTDLNTLRCCPLMPYHDARRPYVNYWFCSAEGGDVRSWNKHVTRAALERLESDGGACIMYTHFGKGFRSAEEGLDRTFRQMLEHLASRPGWFVPVGVLLDHLRAANGGVRITDRDRAALERRWLWDKLRQRLPGRRNAG